MAELVSISRSRTKSASRVERARILLAYREDPSFFAVGQLHRRDSSDGRALRCAGVGLWSDGCARRSSAAGQGASITVEAKAWPLSLACRKAKDLGYPHELWTTRLLARHVREQGPAEGHACLGQSGPGNLVQDSAMRQEIKPHKVRYYLETPRPRIRAEDGRSPVRLPRGRVAETGGGAVEEEAERPRWRSFPTTRSPAYRRSQPRRPICRPSPAPSDLGPRSRIRAIGNAQPAGRHRSGDRRRPRQRRG